MGKILTIAGLVLGVVLTFGQACSKAGLKSKTYDLSSATSTAPPAEAAATCNTPPGFSGSPKTIVEAIDMINALPKPVTVGCFLQSLKRPLNVTLTSSVRSMQPAYSPQSPRIFILINDFTVSVVPEGDGSKVIEFSELTPPATTLKGELAFPVPAAISHSAAYDRILFGTTGTTCQFCHSQETHADDIAFANAFRSSALQPQADTIVSLDSLKTEWTNCNSIAQPDRCAILEGLFGHGEVDSTSMPTAYPFFNLGGNQPN